MRNTSHTPQALETDDKQEGTTIYAQRGISSIDQVGITACVVTTDRKVVYRGPYGHGQIITQDPPGYPSEAAPLRGLRSLHGWVLRRKEDDTPVAKVFMEAGSSVAIAALTRWFQTGELPLKSQAASPLAEDVDRLEHWLAMDLWLHSYTLPTTGGGVQGLPWRSREVLRPKDEFRLHAMPRLGTRWIPSLPVLSPTKDEVKSLLERQQCQDESMALRQLDELDSASAEIALKLDLTREIITSTLSRLRMRHAEQVNLLSVLSGSHFEYYHSGTLLPTWCPNERSGPPCGRNDSFQHLLNCYNLRRHFATGPGAVNFPTLLARRTLLKGPKGARPRYITR